MNRWLCLLAVATLTACQADTEDLNTFFAEVAQNNPAPIDPYPEFSKPALFTYQAQTFPSPFEKPLGSAHQRLSVKKANCRQPDINRAKQPLENYGTDALAITGFFTSQNKQWVLIKANDGRLFKASQGSYLGLFFGVITEIDNGVVFITEMLPDGAGCWQQKQNRLTMPERSGEEKNV